MGVGFFRPSRAGCFNGFFTHGLRRGLYSCAALRLEVGWAFPLLAQSAREKWGTRPFHGCCFNGFYPRLAPWAAFLRRFAAGGGLGFPTSRAKCAREMGHPAALPGLVFLMAFTHGLRRGLHSCAALRLEVGWAFPLLAQSAREKWGTRRLWIRGFPPFPQRARKEWGTRHPSFMCHLHLQRWNG
jgi:hypothetical protein